MLYIPAGLLMLFFGGFLVKTGLCLVSFILVAHLAYLVAIAVGLEHFAVLLFTLLCASAAFLFVLEACEQGPDFATGAVLGACIAMTLLPAPLLSEILAVPVLACAFGLVFELVPKEVSVFVTSYGGGYMIFFGMELIDSEVVNGVRTVPAFVQPSNVDIWFSVLSFLVVGMLGCCVQFILISGQSQRHISRSHYIDIP